MTASIRFQDGAGYDRFMGVWSRAVGAQFLDWLAVPSEARWLDVGCGNGAFTQLILLQAQPAQVQGIDPSAEQIAFAREQAALDAAQFDLGDAQALPYADASHDVAVMPLVIFFLPDPALGVAEMARVVRPDGWVAAYAWDMLGGGFPYRMLRSALADLGIEAPMPPNPQVSSLEALRNLWQQAGLRDIRTEVFRVERRFDSFEAFWDIVLCGPIIASIVAELSPEQLSRLQAHLRQNITIAADGSLTLSAHANAICGRR